MPPISATEQIALGCGTIGFDRDIFTGSPSLQKLVDTYTPVLTQEETDFLNNEVETPADELPARRIIGKNQIVAAAEEGIDVLFVGKDVGIGHRLASQLLKLFAGLVHRQGSPMAGSSRLSASTSAT